MGVTAAVNWNSSKYGEFTLQKLLPFPWEDNILSLSETDFKEMENEVETKNKIFWRKIDAMMNKDKTDC